MPRYGCPCCNLQTLLGSRRRALFTICPVCRWEDDNVQYDDIDYGGGANRVSLREAQENFRRHGVSDLKRSDGCAPAAPDERT